MVVDVGNVRGISRAYVPLRPTNTSFPETCSVDCTCYGPHCTGKFNNEVTGEVQPSDGYCGGRRGTKSVNYKLDRRGGFCVQQASTRASLMAFAQLRRFNAVKGQKIVDAKWGAAVGLFMFWVKSSGVQFLEISGERSSLTSSGFDLRDQLLMTNRRFGLLPLHPTSWAIHSCAVAEAALSLVHFIQIISANCLLTQL